MNVAQTILSQLGGSVFVAMTGAKNFVGSEDGVSMKIGKNAKGVTHVKITLNAQDTYDVKYYAVRGMKLTTKAESNGIYADMLQKDFEANTGLYVKF